MAAIVENRGDLERQCLSSLRGRVRRRDLDTIDPRILFLRTRRAARDPFCQDLIFRRIRLKRSPPLCGIVFVALSSMRLRAGSSRLIRRPWADLVIVR